MKYLHTMIRVQNLEKALHFFVDILGLKVSRQKDYPEGKFTLVFLSTGEKDSSEIELTYNWDQTEPYSVGRNFGHLAYEVENIYETCEKIQSMGVIINRPPRDGRMAFVRSPDLISIELLQKGNSLPPKEPWVSMPNTGEW
ncbi:VOC family protein [Leptospira paudalimensis]|uniref:Aldoketomutase n=1 Tax=Leptospira paudalimensis TaxID=2950024 RepID=A0ABT3M9E4_9LEPT|nr:VOC family protein [Leptospira paudalimensis]MCW7505002.1 VOC family protein [Leptospira paudalimensis]